MGMIYVYVSDLNGKWLYPLPEAKVNTITDTLNDVSVCEFVVPQNGTNVDQIDGWRREIQVWEDLDDGTTEMVFCGPPTAEKGNEASATFTAESVLTHLGTRIIDRTTLTYSSIEQRTIAWNLVAYAQDESVQGNRNLFITSATISGTTHVRSREYKRDEHQNILDLLKEFPGLNDGFDFDIVLSGTARVFTPYYPKKGSLKYNLAIEIDSSGDRSAGRFEYQRDWNRLATQIYTTGGQLNSTKVDRNYEDTTASAFYKVRQAVQSEGSETDPSWLLDKSIRSVALRKSPVFVPTVVVGRYPIDYRRLALTGDEIPIRINLGRVQVTSTKRILQKKWNVKDDTVELTWTET